MTFVRVRSAAKTDPQHEFDVSEAEYAANQQVYVLVDSKPVHAARPATFVVVSAKKPARKTRRASKNPGENTTAPAGADS